LSQQEAAADRDGDYGEGFRRLVVSEGAHGEHLPRKEAKVGQNRREHPVRVEALVCV
jgi:hypothetical protein